MLSRYERRISLAGPRAKQVTQTAPPALGEMLREFGSALTVQRHFEVAE